MELSNWYIQQTDQIEEIIKNYSKAELSKFKIYWFKRIIRKVDEFQESCPTCVEFKMIIENLISELETTIKDPNPNIDNYNAQIKAIYTHLKTVHHVVAEKHYMHLGTIIGVIVGVGISLAFIDKSAEIEKYGFWGCILIGLVIGKHLDTRANEDGRTIL